jgi:hypothetical protein
VETVTTKTKAAMDTVYTYPSDQDADSKNIAMNQQAKKITNNHSSVIFNEDNQNTKDIYAPMEECYKTKRKSS